MNKKWMFFFALSFLLGCATEKATYREGAGLNYLDFGTYQVGIDNRFEFIGDLEAGNDAVTVAGVLEGRFKTETYIFADAGNDKAEINRAIAVIVYTLSDMAHWSGEADFEDFESNEYNQLLHKGMTELNNISVAVAVLKAHKGDPKISGTTVSEPESISKQDIVVKFGKVVDSSRLIHIEYLEASNENYPDAFFYLKKAKQFIQLEKH
jgi:hypothetical protein